MPRNTRRVTPIATQHHEDDAEEDNPESPDSSPQSLSQSSTDSSLAARAARVKGRLKANFRKGRKRFSVRCSDLKTRGVARKLNASSSSSASSILNRTSGGARLTVLRRKNAALAAALNNKLIECREMEQYNVQLKEENMRINVEMGDLRKRLEEKQGQSEQGSPNANTIEMDKATLEAEFQKRLVDYLEPVKECMTQVLGHTSGLTDSLTRAMHLVSAPGRRSRSMAAMNATSLLMQQKTPFGKSAPGIAVAHVSPRVSGHAIHKPQIEIQRLGPDDIQRLQSGADNRSRRVEERQRRRELEDEREGDEEVEMEDNEDDEEEPLEPNSSRGDLEEGGENGDVLENLAQEQQSRRQQRQERFNMFRMSDIGEEEENSHQVLNDDEALVDADLRQRSSPRRRFSASSLRESLRNVGSPVVLLDDVAGLLREYDIVRDGDEDEEEMDEEEGDDAEDLAIDEPDDEPSEKVLLVPRLVLERVTLQERRTSVSKTSNRRRSSVATTPPSRKAMRKSRQSSVGLSKRQSMGAGAHRMSNSGRLSSVTSITAAPASKKVPVRQPSRRSTSPPTSNNKAEAKNSSETPDRSSKPKQSKEQPAKTPVANKSPVENEMKETPKSRESHEEFQQRLFEEDPLEGPSWLFGPNKKARTSKLAKEILERTRRSSSITLKAKTGDVSKRLNMSKEEDQPIAEEQNCSKTTADMAARSPKRSSSKPSPPTTTGTISEDVTPTESSGSSRNPPRSATASKRKRKNNGSPAAASATAGGPKKRPKNIAFADEVAEDPSVLADTPKKKEKKIAFADEETEDVAAIPKAEDQAKEAGRGRSRRAAAAAASSSLKEPSLTKKIRQGDPISNSIYSDYVPGTKPKVAKKLSTGKK